MSRFARGSRFFSTKYEVNSIFEAIEDDLTRFAGHQVAWARYREDLSTVDDIYDVGVGRVHATPFIIDVISAIRTEGRDQQRDEGFYTSDRLQLTVSMREVQKRGMFDLVENTDAYLKDRVVYDKVTFHPLSVQVAGSLREYDTILSVTLIEVRDDEEVLDPLLGTV